MSGGRWESETDGQVESSGLGKWFWLSAAVAVAVLACLVYVLVAPAPKQASPSPSQAGAGAPAPASGGSSPATSASSTAPEAWGDTGCNGTSGSSDLPKGPPSGVTWQAQGAMSYPTSKDLGPKKTDGVVRTCFQHSPSGALLAAANIIVGASSGPDTSEAVMQRQFTAGPGKTTMIAGVHEPDNKAGTASPAGFQIGACTPQRCIVNLFLTGGEGSGSFTMPMVWSDGDWKLDGTLELRPMLSVALPAGWSQWPIS